MRGHGTQGAGVGAREGDEIAVGVPVAEANIHPARQREPDAETHADLPPRHARIRRA